MKSYLPGMKADQREALLTELYRLANFKMFLDWYAARGRKSANDDSRFRELRLWLATVDKKLDKAMLAMEEVRDAANRYPRRNDQDELYKLIVSKTLNALVRAGNEFGKAMTPVKRMQYALAAAVNPKRRTRAEKNLVPHEPKGLEHDLLLSKKTRQIDLWFIRYAATILDKYHTKDGKPIPHHDQILAGVFEFAFGETRTEGSIRRNLSPSRRNKAAQQLF